MSSSNKILILGIKLNEIFMKLIICFLACIIMNMKGMIIPDVVSDTSIKIFRIENENIRVTCEVDEMFFGLYKGDKTGYLLLNRDGTGEYKYDIFGVAPVGCQEGIIKMEWGFPVDKDNNTVKFKKVYGYSYPVIFKCTGGICFQGCSKVYILDFILDKNDGRLHVSSSDDWEKAR